MFPNKALGDLPLEIIDGDRGANYPKTNEFSERGHCLFLNAGNVSASGFSFSDTAFISEEKDQLLRKGKAQRDDVILTTRGTVGNLALYDESVPFEHVRINSGMVLMRPDKTALDPEFLYYALRSPAFSRQVASLQTGSAQPQLPIRDIKHLRIPLPELSQQKEVSKRVKLIFDKIELNRRMNETLEEMARALFRDWFVDFGPTRRQMDGATDPAAIMGHAFPAGDMPAEVGTGSAPESDNGISSTNPLTATTLAPLFPAKLGDDGLPEGWKSKTLGDVVEPRKGRNITKKTVVPGTVPVVAGGLSPAYFHDTPNVSGPVITASASGANAGFVRLYQQDIWASDCSFISREQTDYVFTIYALLSSRQDEIYKMQHGAAQPHVYPSDLKRLSIADAPEHLWQTLERLLTPMFELLANKQQENQTLAALRDLLLPKLMSGEIRLKDAEALV